MSARATSDSVAACRSGATPAGSTGATSDGVSPGWNRIPESCGAGPAGGGGGERGGESRPVVSERVPLACARRVGAAEECCACVGVPGREPECEWDGVWVCEWECELERLPPV